MSDADHSAPRRPAGHPRADWWHLSQTERQERARVGRPRADGLPAWFTVPQLAEAMGVTARQLEGWLPADLIEQRRGPGTKRRVYVSRLQEREREAYESLRERLHERLLAARAA